MANNKESKADIKRQIKSKTERLHELCDALLKLKEKSDREFRLSGLQHSQSNPFVFKLVSQRYYDDVYSKQISEISKEKSLINKEIYILKKQISDPLKIDKFKFNEIVNFAVKDAFLFIQKNKMYLNYREVYKDIDFSNYYINTETNFKSILKMADGVNYDDIESRWEDIKKLGEYKKSPLSNSEYVVLQNGVYRYANHWGSASTCYWQLDSFASNLLAIGYSEFKDFKIYKAKIYAYATLNPIYIENKNLFSDTILELEELKGRYKLNKTHIKYIEIKISELNRMLGLISIEKKDMNYSEGGNLEPIVKLEIARIAKKHKVSESYISDRLLKGSEIESEHDKTIEYIKKHPSVSYQTARQMIALNHFDEATEYYGDDFDKFEKSVKAKNTKEDMSDKRKRAMAHLAIFRMEKGGMFSNEIIEKLQKLCYLLNTSYRDCVVTDESGRKTITIPIPDKDYFIDYIDADMEASGLAEQEYKINDTHDAIVIYFDTLAKGGDVHGGKSKGNSKCKDGCIVKGASHKDGGVPMKVGEKNIEVEGEEAIIPEYVIDSDKKYKFNGNEMTAAEVFNQINTEHGGNPIYGKGGYLTCKDVRFEMGGDVPSLDNGQAVIKKSAVFSKKKYSIDGKKMKSIEVIDYIISENGGNHVMAEGGSCGCALKFAKGGNTVFEQKVKPSEVPAEEIMASMEQFGKRAFERGDKRAPSQDSHASALFKTITPWLSKYSKAWYKGYDEASLAVPIDDSVIEVKSLEVMDKITDICTHADIEGKKIIAQVSPDQIKYYKSLGFKIKD